MSNKEVVMEDIVLKQLLEKMTSELGSEPKIMKLLSELRPEGVFEHAWNKSFAMEKSVIPQKYQLLIAIAISAAIGSSFCTLPYAQVGSRKDLTNQEIMDAIMLARFISSTAVVNTAGETMKYLLNKAGIK